MVFASCGDNEEVVEDAPLEICFYEYDSTSTEFAWTAYKTSDKVAVGGTFNEIEITSDGSSDNPMSLIESMKFSMKTASVETQNEERNGKIANLFFGTGIPAAILIFNRGKADNTDVLFVDAMPDSFRTPTPK